MNKPKLRSSAATIKATDGYENFVSRVGLNSSNQSGGSMYGLTNLVTRNRMTLEAAYRGSWVVGAVVDNYADDMTREGVSVQLQDPEQVRELHAALQDLNIWNDLNSTIKWGRLYGGGVAVMTIEGQDLSSPLRLQTVGKDQFTGLVVFDRWQLQPDTTQLVRGMPLYYQIVGDSRGMLPGGGIGNMRVHHTRCVRMDGIKLPYYQAVTEQLWSESVVERLYDRLVNFDSATLGAAQLINKASLRTVSIENLRQILSTGGPGEANLLTMFALMRQLQTNEGITLLDAKDKFEAFNYTFAGLDSVILQLGQQISGATGIPLVRLFGQSPAGLNSTGESDLRMYYDNVKAKQESEMRGPMRTILQVLYQSLYGKPAPVEMDFHFVPLWQQTPTEKATNAKTIAETIEGLFTAGLLKKATALKELRTASAETGVFGSITDEDIADAEEEDEAPPEPMVEAMPTGADPSAPPVAAATPKAKKAAAADSIAAKVLSWVTR